MRHEKPQHLATYIPMRGSHPSVLIVEPGSDIRQVNVELMRGIRAANAKARAARLKDEMEEDALFGWGEETDSELAALTQERRRLEVEVDKVCESREQAEMRRALLYEAHGERERKRLIAHFERLSRGVTGTPSLSPWITFIGSVPWCIQPRKPKRAATRYRRHITAFERFDILSRQKGKCYWCGAKTGDAYHIDHVIPLSAGGSDGPENMVAACAFCNLSKGAKHPMDFGGRML